MKFNLLTLLLWFLVIYFIFQIREDVVRFRQLESDLLALKTRISEIGSGNLYFKRRLVKLKEGYYIESLARERLNLIKKGETAFKVCP